MRDRTNDAGRRRSRAGGLVLAAAALFGVAATVALAGRVGMGWRTSLHLAGITMGAVLATAAAGWVILFALRRTSIAIQAAVVAVTSVGAVAVGATVAAHQMFLAKHDLDTLAVILAAAATAGVVVVGAVGWEVARATRTLRDSARRIGDGELDGTIERPSAAEFAELADELSAMATRLERSLTRERAADASRRDLMAWISHDLRTPLASIRAIAEALEDRVVEEPAEVERYYRTLRREADRLAGLVDDLFELSRISSGSLRIELHPVALADLVSDGLAAATAVASARRVRLDGRMRPEAGDVMASSPEAARALSNLLDNAVRHTPPGGTVSVEAGIEDGEAFIAVEDGCGGIPEPDLGRLFEPAFRGEPARTPRADGQGGAGLGLAIARGLIEAHRGDISVANVERGCRFVITLPRAPARPIVRPATAGRDPA